MKTNNTRTMEYIGEDYWGRTVYKCLENNVLWKDINCGKGTKDLYSCQNEFDGEPEYPIKKSFDIVYTNEPKKQTDKSRFNYMMLDRMRCDCEYYLNYGNRNKNRLSDNDEKFHIEIMKELYNNCEVKPEWLTYEKILEYERLMCE